MKVLSGQPAFSWKDLRYTANRMIGDQEDYCANHCDQKAVEIQARHASCAKGVEKPSSDDRPNNPQDDIKEKAFPRFVHNLATDETRHQTQHNPSQK
jgi:hypothetical protein